MYWRNSRFVKFWQE